MKTATRNIDIEAATTYRRKIRFYSNLARTTPVDITGWELAAWITRGSFRIEFSIEITDAENGEAEMLLEPDQTTEVLPGKYVWDLLIRTDSGDVRKHVKGQATIHPTGTRLPTS